MSVVLKSDFDRIAAELEDTQESLVAALARIEAFRQREKVMAQELARLRTADSGTSGDGATGAADTRAAPCSPAIDAAPACAAPSDAPAASKEPKPEVADRPVYIVEIADQVPVMLVSGGRKVSGSTLTGYAAAWSALW
jgi:hypothetical protein